MHSTLGKKVTQRIYASLMCHLADFQADRSLKYYSWKLVHENPCKFMFTCFHLEFTHCRWLKTHKIPRCITITNINKYRSNKYQFYILHYIHFPIKRDLLGRSCRNDELVLYIEVVILALQSLYRCWQFWLTLPWTPAYICVTFINLIFQELNVGSQLLMKYLRF